MSSTLDAGMFAQRAALVMDFLTESEKVHDIDYDAYLEQASYNLVGQACQRWRLTRGETAMLEAFMSGLTSSSALAEEMGVTVHTVKNTFTGILRKAQVKNKAAIALAIYGIRER